MRRLIMGVQRGEGVDYIDGDRLNNRQSSLRIVTPTQNQWNRRVQSNSRCGFNGVAAARNLAKHRQLCYTHATYKGA